MTFRPHWARIAALVLNGLLWTALWAGAATIGSLLATAFRHFIG